MAEHALVGHRVIQPGDLPRHGFGTFVGVVARRGPVVVAGRWGIHVCPRVVGGGIQVTVDLKDVGLGRGLEQVAAVVEHQEMSRAGRARRDPLHLAGGPDLLVARSGSGPVLLDRGRIALVVARRVAEPVKKVSGRGGRQRDAVGGTAGDEGVAVVDDVKLAAHRVDDDLIEGLVVIDGVAVQPVALDGQAGDVHVEPPRVVRDGLAHADIVGLGRVEALDDMVEEPPFPDDIARLVHLDDRIHLGVGVVTREGRVAPGGDALVEADGLVGDVEGREGVELRVEDAHEVVVRHVTGPRLGVGPRIGTNSRSLR